MLTYLIKTIICSAIFWLLYKVVFERERMFRFNRFYLLAALAAAFTIPLLNFPAPVISGWDVGGGHGHTNIITMLETGTLGTDAAAVTGMGGDAAGGAFPFAPLLWGIWAAVAVVLSIRFVLNLRNIRTTIRTSEVNDLGSARMVSINVDNTRPGIPYTFMKWIFVPSDTHPDDEIITHELTHAVQWHSLDKVILELFAIIFWFNPVLVFYRRAIDTNHEYLADEAVLRRHGDVTRYQMLLIRSSDSAVSCRIANNFNQFPITKKRLIMMTKATSPGKALLKQSMIIPFTVLALVLFGNNAAAGGETLSEETMITQSPDRTQQTPGAGATQVQLDEYKQLVDKSSSDRVLKDGKKISVTDMSKYTEEDLDRMKELYEIMSEEQRAQQALHVIPVPLWTVEHPTP